MSLTHPIHVGALVYVSGADGCLHPTTIARVMPTQIMTDCGRRFRLLPRKSPTHRTAHVIGTEVGRPGSRACLPADHVVARYQRECAERAASRAQRQGFTQEAEA
jgi:hypothetical protein